MSLLKQISKEDFDKVISYSQNIPTPQTTELLKIWSQVKREIVERFLDGKIQYTHPEKVRFELNENSKCERIDHFQEYIQNLFNDYYHPLAKFLRQLSIEEFYANSILEDYIISERDNKKIQKGSKIVKSFKYFIEDKELLTDLQNKASEIIQENKVEGYLTFSVHPLDFLSSSENTYNWRSCHALDGEYRAGNLSYMCDRGTMMVYLSGEDKVKLPHFPEDVSWNSKKWRILLHFDQDLDVCFAGRQYPFFSPGALEKVFEIFSNNMATMRHTWGQGPQREKWQGWYNDYIEKFASQESGREVHFEDGRYYVMNGCICDKYETVLDAPNSLHFNDVTRSSCYTKPYYMYKSYYHHTPSTFRVGAAVKCLCCGEAIINGDDSMMCSDCECEYGNSDSDEYRTCDCCGTRYYYEDAWWVGDDMVCPNCADRETFVCDECEDRYYNSEKHYYNGQYICDHCLANKEEEE